MISNFVKLTVTFVLAGMLAAWTAPAAAKSNLKISEVFVDFTNQMILITGNDFDFGPGPLEVTLGEFDLTTNSVNCASVSAQTIECDFSASGLPANGDYRLAVSTKAPNPNFRQRVKCFRDRCSDEYDLTIGPEDTQGSPGLTEFYVVSEFFQFSNTSGDIVNAVASCDVGDRATGGGFQGRAGTFILNGPTPTSPFATGWFVEAVSNGLGGTGFAHVICADRPPLR